jgi:hypothetical protein
MKLTIIGPNSERELVPYPDLEGCELCENVIYLGRQGCFTTNEGKNIPEPELRTYRYLYCMYW